MTDELMALADRVEALTGPCRKTDADIMQAIGWLRDGYVRAIEHCKERPYFWHGTDEKQPTIYAARFTESLDAAMTLVPEGRGWRVEEVGGSYSLAIVGARIHLPWRECATPALALTAAALRARAAKEPEA